MNTVYLFDLANRHAQWAALRQTTIAGNIANANTPRFEALDIEPFDTVLDKTRLVMTATTPGHLTPGANAAADVGSRHADSWDVTHSGNSVRIDQELMKANQAARDFSLDTNIIRSFHRMILTSLRSS